MSHRRIWVWMVELPRGQRAYRSVDYSRMRGVLLSNTVRLPDGLHGGTVCRHVCLTQAEWDVIRVMGELSECKRWYVVS